MLSGRPGDELESHLDFIFGFEDVGQVDRTEAEIAHRDGLCGFAGEGIFGVYQLYRELDRPGDVPYGQVVGVEFLYLDHQKPVKACQVG